MEIATNGFDARLTNQPFLVFLLSGTLALNAERQSAWRRIPELYCGNTKLKWVNNTCTNSFRSEQVEEIEEVTS